MTTKKREIKLKVINRLVLRVWLGKAVQLGRIKNKETEWNKKRKKGASEKEKKNHNKLLL